MREQSAAAVNFAAIAFVLGFAAAAFAPQIFNDPDTWWHLATGDWILAHHAVPTSDIFTFTFAGRSWNAHEWLSEVLMSLSFRGASWNGLHILFGLAFGATAAIVAGSLRQRMDAIPALLATVLGMACVTGSLLARPHLLALPLLALWTLMLVRARSENRAPPLWSAALMMLWANLHGSFAFGLALTGALGFEAVMESTDRRTALRQWSPVLSAQIVAALLTPQGLDGLLFPFRLLVMPGIFGEGEWAPSDFTHLTPFLLTLLSMIFVLALGKVRMRPIRALLILGFLFLALSHARHQMLFGVIAPLLAMPALGASWPAKAAPGNAMTKRGAVAVLALLLLARLAWPAARGEDPVTPVAALAHVPSDLRRQPALNAYDYGGYLIFQGVKVFIDGRADMYPADFLENYDRLAAGGDTLAATLAGHHIVWTIFQSKSPTALALDHMPGWHRLYGDANAVVHVRDQPPPPG